MEFFLQSNVIKKLNKTHVFIFFVICVPLLFALNNIVNITNGVLLKIFALFNNLVIVSKDKSNPSITSEIKVIFLLEKIDQIKPLEKRTAFLKLTTCCPSKCKSCLSMLLNVKAVLSVSFCYHHSTEVIFHVGCKQLYVNNIIETSNLPTIAYCFLK
ncbi:hypothetical protein RFI_23399 [Reticulomyxa filosa]|uniref:Uncharacterized protein n=1 Tax=Reticulomyxa filosa TaxID=46433 RepID=X6MJF0_RETFI|nr:hypothetical protein RFI_23399 [Reticulomyxa filosa]|eukprot:ETO13969.1 hypothetical protein RFI_23399 [Reticulomyxa filosa]